MRQDIMRVMCLLWRSLLCPHGLKACHDCIKAGPLRGRVGQAALRERPVGLRSVRRELQGLALHDDAVHDLRMLHAGPGSAAGHHLPQQHAERVHVTGLRSRCTVSEDANHRDSDIAGKPRLCSRVIIAHSSAPSADTSQACTVHHRLAMSHTDLETRTSIGLQALKSDPVGAQASRIAG